MKWNSRGYLSILYICPQFAICHQIPWFIANCSFALALRAQVKKYPITFDHRFLLQIWPRENVQLMGFGSARTVLKLPTHLGPILRAVLRQMSLKLLTDTTGKTVQVCFENTQISSVLFLQIFFQLFRLFLYCGISYSYFRNGRIQCFICIHSRITLYFISI